jgi:hypothetical protein
VRKKEEMATDGQISLIKSIARDLAYPPRDIDVIASMLTRRTAGAYIEVLKGQPRKWERPPLAEGFYHRRGRIYRVGRSEYGRPYAVRLMFDGSEVYAPGIIRQLRSSDAL